MYNIIVYKSMSTLYAYFEWAGLFHFYRGSHAQMAQIPYQRVQDLANSLCGDGTSISSQPADVSLTLA